jgi:hypothetical protein
VLNALINRQAWDTTGDFRVQIAFSTFLRLVTHRFVVTFPYHDLEVKIKREHVQGSAENDGIKPQVEPITEDTVRRMENPGKVEVCKSSSSKNE